MSLETGPMRRGYLRIDQRREALTAAEVKRLLLAVEPDPYWHAVFLLMMRSGLRSNELRSLDVADFDADRGLIRVRRGRGGYERLVPIGPKVTAAIREHLRTRPHQDAVALFPTRTSSRISNRYLRTKVKATGREAGLARDLHPQALLPLINVDDPHVRSAVVSTDDDDAQASGSYDWLAQLVDTQRALLISVATGGASPEQADQEYRRRQEELAAATARLGLPNPFPWRSLWDWHTFYARRLATHDERRAHIDRLAEPILVELTTKVPEPSLLPSETWKAVEFRAGELRKDLASASDVDDYQDIGRRSRELIIATVNIVFDELMVPVGQVIPQASNAKARMDLAVEALLSNADGRGELRTVFRSITRAAWDLSQTVTHSNTAARLDAMMAAECTMLLIQGLRQLDRERYSKRTRTRADKHS